MANASNNTVHCPVCGSDRVDSIQYLPEGGADHDVTGRPLDWPEVKEFLPEQSPVPRHRCKRCGYEFA